MRLFVIGLCHVQIRLRSIFSIFMQYVPSSYFVRIQKIEELFHIRDTCWSLRLSKYDMNKTWNKVSQI